MGVATLWTIVTSSEETQGKFNGGNGVIREIEFLKDGILVGILSERRTFSPYGMAGGEDG